MDGEPAPTVAVTLGRCDETRAEVFLRFAPPGAISGALTGPQRGRDTTLPVCARLEPTPTPGVARTILTEPAYWTPDLPNLYRARATLEAPGSSPRTVDRLVGLRRLGIRGRSLWLDGRRWVPRGCRVDDADGLLACKAAALAAVIAEPEPTLLSRADMIGVAVLAAVSGSTASATAVADRIAAWSAHPSVILAILPAGIPAAHTTEIAAAVRPRKDTLLLAAAATGADPRPAALPAGIEALVVTSADDARPHDSWRGGAPWPLLAWHREPGPPAVDRRPCDALQAALATWRGVGADERHTWDWAGYVVG